MTNYEPKTSASRGDIAIIGMAAHLPGASTVEEYWSNLRAGISSIRALSKDELLANGESPERLAHKNYVPHASVLKDFDHFDSEFFGLSPKDAAIMDPQHRQFLEVCWEAFDNAGHRPESFPGTIGVYAGCGMGSYFYFNVCSNRDLVEGTGLFLLRHTGNDKDFLSTRVSHIFDLKGPSVAIQTACSTSLAATHYAAAALLRGECDMALAGGVTIELPHGRGYIFKEGEILSPDGECHAFDHRAKGTVFGSGAGVVLLRRLEDAIRDGDHIWAVIKGTAVNNDGAAKAGYLAPSVEGQSKAIAAALANAGATPDTIDYVECHGTGTYLGDPIEVASLNAAFGPEQAGSKSVKIGSVKTNIGHLDTASGVASLIKATLALHNKEIPPSLGFEKPNPAIDFEDGPFDVATDLTPWVSKVGPRRAGVNSLGVGGTNVFAILEEAPVRAASEESDWPLQIITVSGRTKAALDANAKALAAHLRAHPELPLADVAYTLQEGRRIFEKRRVLVAETAEEAAALLEANEPRRVFTHEVLPETPEVVFMFPGGGAQYAGMAKGLYATEPVFKDWVDKGLAILQPKLDYDIKKIWLPDAASREAAIERLKTPSVQLPLIMIVEYALAQLWMSWGVKPAALVGHSMGENTAACVAGVISFEDCISLVHLRGQLFDTVPPGGMLSVPMPASELMPHLGEDLDLASANSPRASVASGPKPALEALKAKLAEDGIESQMIPIDIAAHSRMLEPILDRFRAFLRSISLKAPKVPFVSNRTGAFITAADATNPDYWVGHLRNTVHFADCIATLAEKPNRVFLEVGPGKALGSLTQQSGLVPSQQVLPSLRHPEEQIADDAHFLQVLGRLSALGAAVDWTQIWGEARRNRLPLPTYQFQRDRYFIEAKALTAPEVSSRLMRRDDIESWGYKPVWRPQFADCAIDVDTELSQAAQQTWLVFMDEAGVGTRLVKRLRSAGQRVIEVTTGDAFGLTGEDRYALAPEQGREGYESLIADLVEKNAAPTRIVHLWLATQTETFRPGSNFFHRTQEQGFYSLLYLAQALSSANVPTPIGMTVVTSGAAKVRGETLPYPEKATVTGPARVIPRELPGVTVTLLDVDLPAAPVKGLFKSKPADGASLDRLAKMVLEDAIATPTNAVAAIRGEKRFVQSFEAAPLTDAGETPALRDGGVALITGGLGGIGLSIAEDLAARSKAKLVLVGRSALPDRDSWDALLRTRSPQDRTVQRIRAVRHLEELGAEVMVAAADVCNGEDMRAAVAAARARFGEIHAVIHAAGVIADAPLLTKTSSSVEDVFAPKVQGTRLLSELFPDGSLDWMVVFSSSSTVTAPAGQVDYVAANEYLNAFAKSRAGGKTRVLSLAWGIWNEVGMAAAALGEKPAHADLPPEPIEQSLIKEARFDESGERVYTAEWSTAREWVLDGHRTKAGDALLPGTGYLELAAEAMRAHGEQGPFAIRDVMFLRPLAVADGEERAVRVRLTPKGRGFDFRVEAQVTVDGREAYETNAEARMEPIARSDRRIDLGAIAARCATRGVIPDGERLRAPQEAHLAFGERWWVLKSMALGNGEGLAELELPAAFLGDLDAGFRLHPALLDIATGWAMDIIPGYTSTNLWVPVSYRSIAVQADLPRAISSHVRLAGEIVPGSPFATVDVTLTDPTGRVLVEIEGFTMKRLDRTEFARPGKPSAQEVTFVDGRQASARPRSAAEEQLAHNLSQGILPMEGAAVFRRALALGAPQLVATSLDLKDLVAQAERGASTEDSGGTKFQRPKLESDYVAPRNDVEKTLAGFWEDLLGVENVGVEDSFFDLGGHSLIAVRLFMMIKNVYRVEFPISVLFEAPTIAKCAALIAERAGIDPNGPANADAATPAGAEIKSFKRRFEHVVAMHEGSGGPKTPIFLVAGMFGNVLNLRHLAQRLGTDRPFYGLQARGLYGDMEPHTDIAEAARAYIAELRSVQPHGPYVLGGFSGGGITAYEMARQLDAAGETVSLVMMLDTPLPVRPSLTRQDKALIKLHEFRRKGISYLSEWARNRIAWEMRRFAKPTGQDAPKQVQFQNGAMEAAFRTAVGSYKVERWTGNVALFRPPLDMFYKVSGGRWVDSEKEYVYPDNDWTQWAPALQVYEVPGDHDSMVLEPNVRVLADRMRKCIEAAEAADRNRAASNVRSVAAE